VELGAVDRDHPGADESRPRAEREHRAEQLGERPLVAGEKAGDRGVVGDPVGGDHPVGDVLAAVALDRARGALLGRIRIEQKRDHHRGLVPGAAVAVWAVVGVERLEVDLLDGPDHEPREMVLGQPLGQRGRQQKSLLTMTFDEVVGHGRIVFARPDRPVCATAVCHER
jgi:hypothetical protein